MTTDNSHKGMKLTEVGWIPEDWVVKELVEVAFLKSGKTIDFKTTPIGPYPCYGGNGIRCYLNVFSHEGNYPIIGRQGELCGNVNFASGKFYATEHAVICKPKESNNAYWLFHVLDRANINQFKTGNAQPGLSVEKINYEVKLACPSPVEQQKISSVLSDIDTLISSLSSTIEKKRLVKKGTMQQLLTGKTRLKGYKEEWGKCVLGDIGQFSKGRGISRDQANSGNIPCIRYGEIYTTHNDYIREFTSFISEDIAATSKQLRKGDILFAGSGETKEEIGKAVAFINDIEAYAGGDIIILSPTIECDSRFLGYLLNTEEVVKQKSAMGQGDAVVHIHANDLADVEIQLPSIEEQFDIATILTTMDNEILSLEAELEKYKQLKQGMMQKLLTGQIRLK